MVIIVIIKCNNTNSWVMTEFENLVKEYIEFPLLKIIFFASACFLVRDPQVHFIHLLKIKVTISKLMITYN